MFNKVITKNVCAWRSFFHCNTNMTFLNICRILCGNCSTGTNTPILQDRFIEFFRRNTRYSAYVVPDEREMTSCIVNKLNENVPVEQIIGNITAVKLPSFLHSLCMQRHTLSSHDLQRILLVLDDVYSKKFSYMDRERVLQCVHLWHKLCEGNTVATQIYQEFMRTASIWLTKRNNSLELLVYLMFYIGMCKKIKKAQYLIKSCLWEIDMYIKSLSLDELCIIASSSYKCSVQIKSANLLHCICNAVEINFDTLVSDPAYLVTFVKGLRFAKCYNFNVMDKMASNVHSNKIWEMNFTAKVHILAMYAEALYDKKHFIHSLIQSCIQDAHLSYTTETTNYPTLRMKDISRLLWAASFLGYSISHQELKDIIYELQRSVNENRHLKEPEHAVGSLLSLWSMGLKEHVLFRASISKDLMDILTEKHPFRIRARLSLLLTCVQIEMPELLNDKHFGWKTRNIIPSEALAKHLQRRNILKQIFSAVTNLGNHMKLHAVCGCHIPNLNILGITVTAPSGKVLHVEVLDAEVCLRETHTPHGLMKLKLRLLETLGHKVLVIRDDQFDLERNTSEMYVFLEDKLAKLQNRRGA